MNCACFIFNITTIGTPYALHTQFFFLVESKYGGLPDTCYVTPYRYYTVTLILVELHTYTVDEYIINIYNKLSNTFS